MLLRFLCLIFQSMATSHIPQIFLRITVQNQIHVAQRVVIDKVVSSVCCAIVTSSTSSTPVQQLHAAGVYVEFAGSFIVLHVCVLSTLRHLYSCDLCDTVFLLIRFRTHSRLVRAGACREESPPSCWRKTALPLKSPTGAFIAAQPRHSHFQRKRKIRTLLLSRKGSDFHCLVRVVIQHFLKTIVVQFVFEVIG